jgi:hypothetical protein
MTGNFFRIPNAKKISGHNVQIAPSRDVRRVNLIESKGGPAIPPRSALASEGCRSRSKFENVRSVVLLYLQIARRSLLVDLLLGEEVVIVAAAGRKHER